MRRTRKTIRHSKKEGQGALFCFAQKTGESAGGGAFSVGKTKPGIANGANRTGRKNKAKRVQADKRKRAKGLLRRRGKGVGVKRGGRMSGGVIYAGEKQDSQRRTGENKTDKMVAKGEKEITVKKITRRRALYRAGADKCAAGA